MIDLTQIAFVQSSSGVDVPVPLIKVIEHDCKSALCEVNDLLLHCREQLADEVLRAQALAFFVVR